MTDTHFVLFTTDNCVNCPFVKAYVAANSEGLDVTIMDARAQPAVTGMFNVRQVPTLLKLGKENEELGRCVGNDLSKIEELLRA